MKDTVLSLLQVMKDMQFDLDPTVRHIELTQFVIFSATDIKETEKRLKAAKTAYPFSGTPWEDAYHALRDAGTFRVPSPRAKGTDAERAVKDNTLPGSDPKANTDRTHFYSKGFHHSHVVFEDWSAAAWDCLLNRYVVCDDIREFTNH